MPEHTIPNSLIENLRNGNAAIIVGAGIGVPSWKQLLERMNTELKTRGETGDEDASKDVDKLLHKGNLVRASAFLARQLGSEVCDKIVADTWGDIKDGTEVAKALASLPVRQLWTTFPGNVLEKSMSEHLPEDWPLPKVYTYLEASAVDKRHRTVLKILGDLDSFVATPKSIRQALSGANDLREFIRPYYASGTLLFVGFRYGDPDLAALLDRVLGAFEPTQSEHFLACSSVGPVTVDELESEHSVKVINLSGKGADDAAVTSLLSLLGELKKRCDAEGISLVRKQPEADDLEGWMDLLHEDHFDKEAEQAVKNMAEQAREKSDSERLVEVLMSLVEVEEASANRAAILREVSQVFETKMEDPGGAFAAITAALREDPAELDALKSAERLAEKTNGWEELVADVAAVTGELEDTKLAAIYYTHLGRWYHRKLNHLEYSVASYREAIRRDPKFLDAYTGLSDAYRVQQNWGELADLIDTSVALNENVEGKFDSYLALADICESQLSSTPRAIEAYEQAIALDTQVDDAFIALERLFRKSEHWGKLAKVLERKAEYVEKGGNEASAIAIRREINSMQTDKLGDLEGALAKQEAALQDNPKDIEVLLALEELYDKLGQTEKYLDVLTTLAKVSSQEERPVLLRRLAMELEEQEEGKVRAVEALEQLIEVDANAEDAFRSLERLHREMHNWEGLVAILKQHATIENSPSLRSTILIKAAAIYEIELSDPHKAVDMLESALADSPKNADAMGALARMYKRTESWLQAADMFALHAEKLGNSGAAEWAAAGHVSFEKLSDNGKAREYLEKALEIGPHNLEALKTLANLHKVESAWESAVNRMINAADACSNRLESVDFLLEASQICDAKLGDRKRGLHTLKKVLEIDPENMDAGTKIAERLVAAQKWREALPILEMVLRRVEPEDKFELATRSVEVGKICLELGELENAQKYLAKAVELDPENLEAALSLGDAMFAIAKEQDDEVVWRNVDKNYRSMLARHRSSLADSQVVDLWHRLGCTARALGDVAKAESALRRALERDSGHSPTLNTLSEIAIEKDDWKTLVSCKRGMLGSYGETEHVSALEEIGDLCRDKLKDSEKALGAYLEASQMRPNDRGILHKTLELQTVQKDWRNAVTTLDSLAKSENTPESRAKFHYAAAVICRDKLSDVSLAVEFFTRALDDDPSRQKAFNAIDTLLSGKKDWSALARAHRKMLKTVGSEAPDEMQLRLWTRLGDISVEYLGDNAAAMTAYEVVVSLDPGDLERREHLVNLYLEDGGRLEDVIEQLQILISADPDRVEFYKVLSEQYRTNKETDKAYCVAQALVFLKAASKEEESIFISGHPQTFVAAKRTLTEELWQKAIIHTQEDQHVNAVFSSIIGPVASTTAQPLSSFNFSGKTVSGTDTALSRVFGYASGVLGLSPAPTLFVESEGSFGLRVANTVADGKLKPTLVADLVHSSKGNQAELAFELGKRMAYFRPERYLNFALQTVPKLEGAFYGALQASGNEVEGHCNEEMAGRLRKTVPSAVLDHVGSVARQMPIDPDDGVINSWRSATDLTANRVGLILCNDLQVAAKAIATEKVTQSTLSAKDRLRDLLAYSVSEEYFSVRKHLGLNL